MLLTELETQDTMENTTLIYSCRSNGTVNFTLYLTKKHADFNFNVSNVPFLSSNILSSSTYCVFLFSSWYEMPEFAHPLNVVL